jgi:hypothetical protein
MIFSFARLQRERIRSRQCISLILKRSASFLLLWPFGSRTFFSFSAAGGFFPPLAAFFLGSFCCLLRGDVHVAEAAVGALAVEPGTPGKAFFDDGLVIELSNVSAERGDSEYNWPVSTVKRRR